MRQALFMFGLANQKREDSVEKSKKKILRNLSLVVGFVLAIGMLYVSMNHFRPAEVMSDIAKPKVSKNASSATAAKDDKQGNLIARDASKVDIEFYQQDLPLSPEEEQKFLAEVIDVFRVKARSYANPDDLSPYLSNLNSRYRRGVRTILNKLRAESTSDSDAMDKMSYVDYLNYRMRWDKNILDDIGEIVKDPLDSFKSKRYMALRMAENVELISGVAVVDVDRAIKAALEIEDDRMKKLALGGIHDTLINLGQTWESSTEKIREFYPAYIRNKL
ncbi:MAG: hypothetical protein M3Q07_09025 [Pseudobdellovibrionaceae bacterium]|nr:hypothetical protein [Pseudobdellovibrionaceae bacterium]